MSLTWSITGEKYCCNHFSHKLSSIVNLFSSTEKCQWPQIITEPQLWTTCFSFGSVALSSETEQAWAAVCRSADIHYSVIRFRRCYPKTNFLFLFWSIKTQVTKATTFTQCRKWSATTAYSAVCRWLTCLNTLFALLHHRTKVCVKPVSEIPSVGSYKQSY